MAIAFDAVSTRQANGGETTLTFAFTCEEVKKNMDVEKTHPSGGMIVEKVGKN